MMSGSAKKNIWILEETCESCGELLEFEAFDHDDLECAECGQAIFVRRGEVSFASPVVGWCSWCFAQSEHLLKTQNYVRRNVYHCSECGNETLLCRAPGCSNLTRGSDKWDDEFCAEHDGSIVAFDKADTKVARLEEYLTYLSGGKLNLARGGKIAAMGLGGAVVLAPMALLAAPAVGGAIGTTLLTSAAGAPLTGAAATSAGMAWLGGGALTAGGFGMAGGTAVVTALGSALGGAGGGLVARSYLGQV